MTDVKFYGYKHWTLENLPRCFNVGKGLLGRANCHQSRNHKWYAIIKRYGLRVEICVGPVTNKEACAWEIKNIVLMGTFSTNHSHDDPNNIGCNFTKGGEGAPGRHPTEATRNKMSASQRKRPPTKLSTRVKLSVAFKGRSAPNKGKSPSIETRAKMRIASQGRRSILTENDVRNLRHAWATHDPCTKTQFCEHHSAKLGVTPGAIYGIIMHKSWQHLT